MQTILPVLFPRRVSLRFARERLELPDGDFLDLDWARTGSRRLAILSHGLEGDSSAGYIRGLAASLTEAGWDALAWNFRGCSGEPNRLLRAYHSGATDDLGAVIAHAEKHYRRIVLIGISLGGNLTLKHLGENAGHPSIVGGVGISVPVDLAACARALDSRWGNRIYLRRFLASLAAKARAKAERFPEQLALSRLASLETIEQFDEHFTAPVHGFAGAEDYWAKCSARQFLAQIRVPTLLLNAQDDPLLAPGAFPTAEAEANPDLFLEAPSCGGHVGFIDLREGVRPWFERRVVEFLKTQVSP